MSVVPKISTELHDLLYGDQGQYAYLFPYRGKVPLVLEHPFQGLARKAFKVEELVIRTMLDYRFIGWTAKTILGLNLFPMQLAVLQTMWAKPFPMLVASRGAGKSFLLAVYCVLRALLEPRTKIVIVGAGLRQAKLVFQYIEDIWSAAPVLRSIVGGGKKAGPKQSVDICYFRIGDSIVSALPMGDGQRIRGFRANIVIADEFASIPEDIFNVVVRGFTATAKSPLDEARRIAIERRLKQLNLPKDVAKRFTQGAPNGNQIVLSGTAYYAFNHFAKRFEMYTEIIRSRGNPERIAELFGGENMIPENFSWQDYAVIRLPYTHVQEGLLDRKQLAHAKAILPLNIFMMEYGACVTEKAVVDTRPGLRRITEVENGDLVLSHTGRWRKVQARKFRHYCGKMVRLRVGLDDPIEMTADHPLWTQEGFVQAGSLRMGHRFPLNGPRLVNHGCFDLREFNPKVHDQTIDDIEYIYPIWGSYRGNSDSDGATRHQLQYQQTVLKQRRYKSSVPRFVEASDQLGLILGMYAGNGDINKKGTQCNITLNATATNKADLLIKAVKDVFGLRATVTCGANKKGNVLRVHINSKVVCCFLSGMVGKYAHHKSLSCMERFTPEMACGFIRGYWLTDGTLANRSTWHIGSVSRALIAQTRALLLALGCYAGVRHRPPATSVLQDGRTIAGGESWLLLVPAAFRDRLLSILEGHPVCEPVEVMASEYAEFHFEGTVFNLEVEEDHSYLAQGIHQHNCFVRDSDGFFPRSLVESCTTYPSRPISTPDGAVVFTPMTRGVRGRRYVIGIDPAAERDNLAITVLEVWPHHYRVVYVWTCNKPEFERRKKNGLVTSDDYYAYCCSRIRKVVQDFFPERIVMDSQGGGHAIAEMLRNKKLLGEKERPIYPIIDFEEPKPTDAETDGPHILELVAQSSEWNSQSNLFMHKSFETKSLLFPGIDTVKMQAAILIEKAIGVTFDTYEDVVNDIEEQKNEICTIQMTQTTTGKEHFDTPSIQVPGMTEGRKRTGRLRKDRYTSLLLAHRYCYDTSTAPVVELDYDDVAGNIRAVQIDPSEGMYRGPGIGSLRNAGDWLQGDPGIGGVKRGEFV